MLGLQRFRMQETIKTVPASCDTATLVSSWPSDEEPNQDPSQYPSCYHSIP